MDVCSTFILKHQYLAMATAFLRWKAEHWASPTGHRLSTDDDAMAVSPAEVGEPYCKPRHWRPPSRMERSVSAYPASVQDPEALPT